MVATKFSPEEIKGQFCKKAVLADVPSFTVFAKEYQNHRAKAWCIERHCSQSLLRGMQRF